MQYYTPELESLMVQPSMYQPPLTVHRPRDFVPSFRLMDLATDMNEYHAKKGSNSMFDFSKGDPLKNTNIKDLHKDAGAHLNFHGATGKQEIGVVNKFQKGAEKRLNDATHGKGGNRWTAINNQMDTMNDRFTAMNHVMNDAKKVLLLI